MKKSELHNIIKEEISKTLNENELKLAKDKVLKDIELIKAKAKNDWGLLDDIKTQSEKIKNSTSIEQINKILNWLKGGESEPLDKISESQKQSTQQEMKSLMSDILESNKKVKQLMKQKGYEI